MSSAAALKDKGNEALVKQNDPITAIRHYSAAIQLDPSLAVLPLNRALAYLKLSKYADAERDCTTALKLEPGNPKALFRRGLARKGLERYEAAINDLHEAQTLEPKNASITKELDAVVKALEDANAAASAKAAKARAVRARPEPAKEPSPPVASTSKTAVKAESDPTLMREVTSRRLPPGEKPSFGAAKEQRQAREAKQRSAMGLISDLPASRSSVTPSAPSYDPSTAVPSTSASPPATASVPAPVSDPAIPLRDFGVHSAYDFSRAWIEVRESARGSWAPLWVFVQSIEPSRYPSLFDTNLDPDQLAEMLQCSSDTDPTQASRAMAILQELPRCSRFDFVAMLLTESERAAVRDVFKRNAVDPTSTLGQTWGL